MRAGELRLPLHVHTEDSNMPFPRRFKHLLELELIEYED